MKLDFNNIGAAINAAIDDMVENTPTAAEKVKASKAKPKKAEGTGQHGLFNKKTGQMWTGVDAEFTDSLSGDGQMWALPAEVRSAYRSINGSIPRTLEVRELAATEVAAIEGKTGTDVAVPEEILEPELVPTAQEMDAKIRSTADRINTDWTEFATLVNEAESQNIHAELGFASWPEYIADVVKTNMPNVASDVKAIESLVAIMTEAGMSVRSQGEALGISKSKVSRTQTALSQSGTVTPPATVTSKTGRVTARPDRKQPKPTIDWLSDVKPGLTVVPDPKPEPSKAEQGSARRQMEVVEVQANITMIGITVGKLMDEMAGKKAGIAEPLPSEKRIVLEGLMTQWARVQNIFGPVGELAADMGMVLPEWWPIQPGESRLVPADEIPSWWDDSEAGAK